MRYLVLIYDAESTFTKMPPAELQGLMSEWRTFHDSIHASGAVQAGARLRPIATASTVRVRSGKATTTDGPFAETKEQLGGFYLIDVPSLDEALAWARKMPSARFGSIEVRPVWEREEYMH